MMKRIASIFLIVYFVALGGGATVISHYCGGNHMSTFLNPVSDIGCCSKEDPLAEQSGCSSSGCSSNTAEKGHCESKNECGKSCCEDKVMTFQLSELTQPARILPDSPVSLDLPVSIFYAYYLLQDTPENFNPVSHINASPPPGKQSLQSVLAVFLL